MTADLQAAATVPASRQRAALLLMAVMLLMAGSIVLLAFPGPERFLGVGLIALALYYVSAAFAPRLMPFDAAQVSVYVVFPVMAATVKLAEGKLLWCALWLALPAAFAAYNVARRRRAAGAG